MPELAREGASRRVCRRMITEGVGRALWRLNVAAYCCLCLWILADGRFPQTALALKSTLEAAVGLADAPATYPPQLAWRLLALGTVAVCSMGSLVGILAALFVGAATHRRVRSWLAFTLLAAAWLSLGASWREVAWHGQQWRLHSRLNEFNAVASRLRSDWPSEDGQRADLGAFLAYPRGSPRMLLLLTPSAAPRTGVSFTAVERSDDGTLRFELGADEGGAWLEWHPMGDVPMSFVGGLMGHYQLERYAELGGGWFLARYRAPILRSAESAPSRCRGRAA